jgi:hypothetical protein
LIRRGRHLAAAVVLGALCALAWAASAGANHTLKEEISIGPNGGNAAVNAFFDASSQDGTHAVFETSESLVSADTDSVFDIYERVGNTTSLVSIGSSGGNGPSDAFFDGVSDDGSRIFFDTDESLVPADTDSFIDVYQRSGGVTTLVSTGPAGGNGAFDVTFDGLSRDGLHVFFETDEGLLSGDTDSSTDVYDRSGGTTTLVSTGPAGGNGAFTPIYDGTSYSGDHVFFDTDESLVSGDTDSQFDTYDRSGGTTSLVSTGPSGGNGAIPARYQGNSIGGLHVWFETNESLVSGDTDTQNDVYDRFGGTTTQVSTGPTGGNGALPAFFDGAATDGSHVFVHTAESLVAGDTDTKRDVYDRSGGTTTLLTTGPAGGNGALDAFFAGSSVDGLHVFFETTESLVAADTDTRQDVYERVGGTTNRVSTGTAGGNGAFDAFFDGASLDGTRVFFDTTEPLEASDTDASSDVYERWIGSTTHITIGPTGGNAALGAFFDGASADGTRAFFNTRESLVSGDTDTTRDVYAATVAGYARPKGASPLRASLVPAFNQCTAPNRTHGAPLAFGSCAPPVQSSAQLTVGAPDSNGAGANSIGAVTYSVIVGNPTPPNDADVKLTVSMTDVRVKATLADYTGQLQVDAGARVTDRLNGPSSDEPATGTDTSFPVTVPCAATGSTTIGSTCSVSTTFNAVTPGAIVESQRAIWELGDVKVFDGGPDGVASTGPNTLFARQGVFVP